MFHLELNALQTFFVTIVVLLMGIGIKKRIYFLEKFCIPSPVVGGFLVSLILWACKSLNLLEIHFTITLQVYLMVAFFTTVGITGSLKLLATGGKTLIVYILICWFVVLWQDVFGAGLAMLMGVKPIIGVMAGAVSLTGGHGNAAAFGGMAESLGVEAATVAAIAAATFGLISGSLIGGPLARYLIQKNKVTIEPDMFAHAPEVKENLMTEIDHINETHFLKMLGFVVGLMAVGNACAAYFTDVTGYSLPAYVGAMVVAIVARNINDFTHLVTIHEKSINLISDISLGLFLTMAMMTLRIWEIQSIALPLLIILVLQVIFLTAFAAFVVFRILGKTYDAAVMCSGLMGHGLGATPNAMANMSSVCEHYHMMSPKAFMIVPLCGAVLVDIVGIPLNTYLVNLFAHWY